MENLSARGLCPATRDASDDAALSDAETLIARVPSLHRLVRQRVRGISPIPSSGPDFDTSHSEPSWPGWVFVSFPPPGPKRAIRIAEGIIHEAMHHNLSTLEGRVALVSGRQQLYSPWKREARPASGVLHGVYVFVCLNTFFRHLATHDSTTGRHAWTRVTEILGELSYIDHAALNDALTPLGQRFYRALLEASGDAFE